MSNTPNCIDYALGKIANEHCNHPHFMTAVGDKLPYNSKEGGYLGIHHPANITIDLREIVAIKQISIKFMHPNDPLNETPIAKQQYAFRLLCSIDGEKWQILFDSTETSKPYRVGWIRGLFNTEQKMRYFRIHALHNPANSGFHIVRLRLFNIINPNIPVDDEITLSNTPEYEINDSTPLATKLLNLAERLYRSTPNSYKIESSTDNKFNELYNQIIEKSFELQSVDGKIDQIRNIITPHIANTMEKDYKDNRNSFIKECIISIIIFISYIIIKFYKHN